MQPMADARPTLRSLLDALRAHPAAGVLRADGHALLGLALGKPRSFVFAHPEAEVDAVAAARFAELCERRASGEPFAYLSGRAEFWSLELDVTPDTLVPRPETERLVECALALCAAPAARVLDLGTGSGAIALALAAERPGWDVLGADVDPCALAVARGNALRLGSGARFVQSDWFAAFAGERFDLVASNPPYVEDTDPCLDDDGLRREPRHALASGRDGLDALRAIVAAAPRHLRPHGVLACEHGATQGSAVRALFVNAGFTEVTTARDLAGLERVTHGRLAGSATHG